MSETCSGVSPETPLWDEADQGSQEDEDASPTKHCHSKCISPKSILKDTPSPDIKKRAGRALAWQDFHGKELYTVMEFVASDAETSDDEDVWEEKRPCCPIM